MTPSINILMGGPDAEREVSLESGAAVAQGLRDAGDWHVIETVLDTPNAESFRALDGDVVFPALHGTWGEGGGAQRELERIGQRFVGSTSDAAALAMDKMATKTRLVGFPSPPAQSLEPGDACDIEPPLVLKPIDDGSSIDLRICRSRDEVEAARAELHIRRPRLMAERYVEGRELTVGIVEGVTLPILEIIPAVEFYDYDAKYARDDTNYVVDPELPEDVSRRCAEIAMTAWSRVGCRDLARVDFILEGDTPWFLEINTMPGFTSHSLLPKAAAAVGITFPELCDRLARAALERSEPPLLKTAPTMPPMHTGQQ